MFGLVLVLALVAVYVSVRHTLVDALEADLRTLAATEVASALDEYEGIHMHDFDNPAILNASHATKYVQILTSSGEVLDQSSYLSSREPLVDAATLERILRGEGVMTDVRLNGARGRAFGLAADKDGARYAFVVAVPLDTIDVALSTLAKSLVLAGALALLATGVVGFRLASLALAPVDLMTDRARRIGEDTLTARLDEPGTGDEIDRLAHVLNEMLDRLASAVASHQRFAADASHELRSPLAALRGQIEVALRRARTADEYRAVLESCLEEVERLGRLAESLLELARADASGLELDFADVELEPVVVSVERELSAEAETRHVAFENRIPAGLTVIGDADRLRRVLANLIANAIHYTKPGGGTVTVTAQNGGHETRIEVRDSGIGLDAGQREKVFERFWRGDGARSGHTWGTGLGLSICREIVRAHGGRIEVTSAPGAGSTFSVVLPNRLE